MARAGVASLKLEGRMKPAAYVWAVTSAYRSALDALARGEEGVSPAVRRTLKRSFNRGLTDAYLRGVSDNELMSYERSGNRGELVGVLERFEPEPGLSRGTASRCAAPWCCAWTRRWTPATRLSCGR